MLSEVSQLPKGLKVGFQQRSRSTLGQWKRVKAQLGGRGQPVFQLLDKALTQHLEYRELGKITGVMPKIQFRPEQGVNWALQGYANTTWLYNGEEAPELMLYDVRLTYHIQEGAEVRYIHTPPVNDPQPMQSMMKLWREWLDEVDLQFLDVPNYIYNEALIKPDGTGFQLMSCNGVDGVLTVELHCPGWLLTFTIFACNALQARKNLLGAIAQWQAQNPVAEEQP